MTRASLTALTSIAAFAAVSTNGCVVTTACTADSDCPSNDFCNANNECQLIPNGGTGQVDFSWTFNGAQGCSAAGVDQVQVTVGGVSQTFPCYSWANGGRTGSVAGVPTGTQSFTLDGLSFTYDSNFNVTGTAVTYQQTGTVTVAPGDNSAGNIDLPPVGTPSTGLQTGCTSATINSTLQLFWTFAGLTCAQAGVSTVTVSITDTISGNGSINTTAPCTQTNGGTGDGVGYGCFAAGSYPFTLSATGSNGDYFASGTLYANGITDTLAHIDLGPDTTTTAPPAGTGSLTLNFAFGSASQDCATAGLSSVDVFLTDSMGNVVPMTKSSTACSSLPVAISGLTAPGTFYVNAEGLNGSTVAYQLLQYEVSVYPGSTALNYNINVPATAGL